LKNIFKILLVLGLINISLFAGVSLDEALKKESEESFDFIWTLLKVGGFGVIIWGVAGLMAEEQGQENGGKYIKSIVKILVGGVLMGAESISKSLGISS
jgi:hypothetical protein